MHLLSFTACHRKILIKIFLLLSKSNLDAHTSPTRKDPLNASSSLSLTVFFTFFFCLLIADRSALSIQRASGSKTRCLGDSDTSSASLLKVEDDGPSEEDEKRQQHLWFPFGDWLNQKDSSVGQR